MTLMFPTTVNFSFRHFSALFSLHDNVSRFCVGAPPFTIQISHVVMEGNVFYGLGERGTLPKVKMGIFM